MRMRLWRDEATMLQPVSAAAQRHATRIRLYFELEHEGVSGFGEVDPQPFALNGDPDVGEVINELELVVAPQIVRAFQREGEIASWTRIARFAGPRSSSATSVCLVEMAILDRELRAQGLSLRSLWPKTFETPLQETVSLLDHGASWNVSVDARRVRVKTAPGVIDELGLARLSSLSVPVLLDFNCSATGDADVLDQLDQLGDRVTELRVEAVEQPFAAGNVIDHSRLAEQLEVGLSLDEGVRTVRDIEQIVRYGAATLICVKPARVGGYANAKTMILRARELGLEAYLGGFFESPFARAVNRTLAEHVVSVPSDIGVIATLDSVNDSAVRVVDGGFEVAPSSHLLENASLVATFE